MFHVLVTGILVVDPNRVLNLVSDPRVPGSVVVVTRLGDFSIFLAPFKAGKIWNYMENICEIYRNSIEIPHMFHHLPFM